MEGWLSRLDLNVILNLNDLQALNLLSISIKTLEGLGVVFGVELHAVRGKVL